MNWGHAKTIETVRKLGYTAASVARFLGMTTSSMNRMARLEEMTELDAWDKSFAFTPTSPNSSINPLHRIADESGSR
jgi:hypothetical protein